MKKLIFSMSLLAVTLASSAQDILLARRLLIDNDGAKTLHTLAANIPYTITHSKDGSGSFTVNENGVPLGNYPETATIEPVTTSLKNTWLMNSLNNWTEENKKSDGTTTATTLVLDNTSSIPAGAPAGAKYVNIRNLYNAVIKIWFYQEVLYLPAGTYTFSVKVAGYTFADANAYLYTEENGIKTVSPTPITFPGGGWTGTAGKPASPTITYISTGGSVKFGIYINKFGAATGLGDTNIWMFTNFSLVAE